MAINTTIEAVGEKHLATSSDGTGTATVVVGALDNGIMKLTFAEGFDVEATHSESRTELALSALGAAMAVAQHRMAQAVIDRPELCWLPAFQKLGFQFSTKAGRPYVGWPAVDPDNGAHQSQQWMGRIEFWKDGEQTASISYFLPGHPVTWFENESAPDDLGAESLIANAAELDRANLYTAGSAMIECATAIAHTAGRTRLAIHLLHSDELELWATSLGFTFYAEGESHPVYVKELPTATDRLVGFSLDELAAEVERRQLVS